MGDSSHNDDLGRFSFEHRARRLAARGAAPKPRTPKRGIARDLMLIGGIVVVLALIAPFGDVANPN
jgi:hypothetical protein